MNQYTLTEMRTEHLVEVLEIYNYYVLNSTATFHIQPLTIDEMKELVFFKEPKYKTFVICMEDRICGYVLITNFKKRQAYDQTAEVTIYLHPEYLEQGMGTVGLSYIEEFARINNLHSLIAIISGDNQKSIKLFEKQGYQKCAHYREVGRKFGLILDVLCYQKIINS